MALAGTSGVEGMSGLVSPIAVEVEGSGKTFARPTVSDEPAASSAPFKFWLVSSGRSSSNPGFAASNCAISCSTILSASVT